MIDVRKKCIAVHCKAGLGRTGCLIGAYLIYRHGFTANECISYMRFMRPGMVVGPQQHWLHLNQGVFREWWLEERIERRLRKQMNAAATSNGGQPIPSTPVRAMQRANIRTSSKTYTPPQQGQRSASNRTPLSEMDQDHGRDNTIGVAEDFLPAPTPGQPRKTQRMDRHHPYSRAASAQPAPVPEEPSSTSSKTTVEAVSVHRTSSDATADDEWILRMRSQRKASAPLSPERTERSQSVTQTTTTTTVYQVIDNDPSNDIENLGTAKIKSATDAVRSSSVSGVLAKVRKTRAATGSGSVVREAGVRKTSGRVGSVSGTRKVSGL
jgi:cell division cycle 14